jgi:hypothetical protein
MGVWNGGGRRLRYQRVARQRLVLSEHLMDEDQPDYYIRFFDQGPQAVGIGDVEVDGFGVRVGCDESISFVYHVTRCCSYLTN